MLNHHSARLPSCPHPFSWQPIDSQSGIISDSPPGVSNLILGQLKLSLARRGQDSTDQPYIICILRIM